MIPALRIKNEEELQKYGTLGYEGMNGERATQALSILKECLTELSRRENIAVRGL